VLSESKNDQKTGLYIKHLFANGGHRHYDKFEVELIRVDKLSGENFQKKICLNLVNKRFALPAVLESGRVLSFSNMVISEDKFFDLKLTSFGKLSMEMRDLRAKKTVPLLFVDHFGFDKHKNFSTTVPIFGTSYVLILMAFKEEVKIFLMNFANRRLMKQMSFPSRIKSYEQFANFLSVVKCDKNGVVLCVGKNFRKKNIKWVVLDQNFNLIDDDEEKSIFLEMMLRYEEETFGDCDEDKFSKLKKIYEILEIVQSTETKHKMHYFWKHQIEGENEPNLLSMNYAKNFEFPYSLIHQENYTKENEKFNLNSIQKIPAENFPSKFLTQKFTQSFT
jgi:hypothetical protein